MTTTDTRHEFLAKEVNGFFNGEYEVVQGQKIPDVQDLKFGKTGKEMELAMLFIDIRESTKIVDGFRRITGAKMYKSFLWGVAQIAKWNEGELRSFNGDGVLIAFNGDSKCTHAAKAALQMSWFCTNVMKPKLKSYFANNKALEGFEFGYGIGIDVGKVLVVRGGIRGENNNDLVWVGNATNYAVKLSGRGTSSCPVYISQDMYKNMNKTSKYGGKDNLDMWEPRVWDGMPNQTIYRSNWTWKP